MKILVACKTEDYKNIGDNILRWAARAGYEFRLFVPYAKHKRFEKAIKDVNWDYYMALGASETLVFRDDLEGYAKEKGFDLLVTIPDTIKSWSEKSWMQPEEMVVYVKAVGSARKAFSENPKKRSKTWPNGVTMKRI